MTARAVLVAAVVVLTMPGTGAADAPRPWAHLASGADVVRGQFTQNKYLAELDKPLTSSGEFVVARGKGLIWRVQAPITTTLVITREHLVEKSQGQITKRLSAGDQPGLRAVTAVLLALFTADTSRLQQFFSIEAVKREANDWQLRLRPKRDSVARLVDSARISGGKTLRRITLRRSNGDRTAIRLRAKAAPGATLTAAEQRLLNPS